MDVRFCFLDGPKEGTAEVQKRGSVPSTMFELGSKLELYEPLRMVYQVVKMERCTVSTFASRCDIHLKCISAEEPPKIEDLMSGLRKFLAETES